MDVFIGILMIFALVFSIISLFIIAAKQGDYICNGCFKLNRLQVLMLI